MSIDQRPLTSADVSDWLELITAVEATDDLGEHFDAEDLRDELADPELTDGDLAGAFDGTELVGWWRAVHRGESEGRMRVHLDGAVRPDRRGEGIGTRLVETMLARADRLHRERRPELPLLAQAVGRSDNEAQARIFSAAGLTVHRWSFGMRVLLDRGVESAPLPSGYRIRPYEAALDDAMRRCHNDAFLDHPNFAPWPVERWHQWVSGSRNFRPELSFVAVADDAPDVPVGYVQTSEFEADTAATGVREAYIAKLGTLRTHRGHGLAGAVLTHALNRPPVAVSGAH